MEMEMRGSSLRMVRIYIFTGWIENNQILFQFLAGVVANLPGLSAGFSMGFSAILIPQLQQPGAEISATLEQGSWIGKIF